MRNTRDEKQQMTERRSPVWMRAFWTMAGADPRLLDRPECAGERARYAFLGAQVTINAVLAGWTASAVTHVLGAGPLVAAAAGGTWGGFIGLVDLAMMSGVRRLPNERATALLRRAAGRIGLSIIAGGVLGLGVEQIVNADIVAVEVERQRAADAADLGGRIDRQFADLETVRNDLAAAERRLAQADSIADARNQEVSAEADGSGGSHHRGAYGVTHVKERAADAARDAARRLHERLDAHVAQLRGRLEARERERSAVRARSEAVAHATDGFPTRYLALRRIERDASIGADVWWLNRKLWLLCTAVELAPLLMKLTAARGVYDAMHEEAEAVAIARADARREVKVEHAKQQAAAWRGRRYALRRDLAAAFDALLKSVRNRLRAQIRGGLAESIAAQVAEELRDQMTAELRTSKSSPRPAGDAGRAWRRRTRDAA